MQREDVASKSVAYVPSMAIRSRPKTPASRSGLQQVLVQPLVSLCGDPVRVAAFVGWLGLDQGVALEPRERPVQVPGPSVIPANTSISLVSAYPCSSPRAKLVNAHQHASLRRT